jgi:hypothetical protein
MLKNKKDFVTILANYDDTINEIKGDDMYCQRGGNTFKYYNKYLKYKKKYLYMKYRKE